MLLYYLIGSLSTIGFFRKVPVCVRFTTKVIFAITKNAVTSAKANGQVIYVIYVICFNETGPPVARADGLANVFHALDKCNYFANALELGVYLRLM